MCKKTIGMIVIILQTTDKLLNKTTETRSIVYTTVGTIMTSQNYSWCLRQRKGDHVTGMLMTQNYRSMHK